MKKQIVYAGALLSGLMFSAISKADVNFDLDDIERWEMVGMEVCLDVSLEKIDGVPVRLEMKIEDDDPTYEFEILAEDGNNYNVECNAEEGLVTEVERSTTADDPIFKKYAKVSMSDAQKTALDFHPGKVIAVEYEVGFDGTVTYEFDIMTDLGPEVKVDVDAATGEIEEANFELYEIGGKEES
ncbi:MAG: PepSY domain-containing protein [Pseudomonadota bacterium]